MAIKERLFELCKDVWRSPFRDETAKLIARLNSTTQEDANTSRDRSEYGYFSRHLNLQFCGYLVLDYSLRNQQPPYNLLSHLHALEESERVILSGAHKTLLELNAQCLNTLLEKIPNCQEIVDPYSQHALHLPEIGSDWLLGVGLLEAFGLAFGEHRGLSWALETQEYVGNLDNKQYLGIMKSLRDSLSKNANSSEGTMQVLFSRDTKLRQRYKHFLALMAIRESLGVIDQLIYQAVSSDKLAYFGIPNIISIDLEVHSINGAHYSFTYLPSRENFNVEPGDIVLYQPYENDKPRLCKVMWENMSFSESDGMLIQLDVIGINDELHPFDALFKNLEKG